MTYRRIGCAVDFSEASRTALESAAELAARLRAELLVIHVSEERPAPGAGAIFAPPPASTSVEKHGPQLETWVREAERLGATARSALIHGRPAEAIAQLASEERVDLLVVASHGRGALRRLVLGSVTEELVRAAPCPVLVVRRPQP